MNDITINQNFEQNICKRISQFLAESYDDYIITVFFEMLKNQIDENSYFFNFKKYIEEIRIFTKIIYNFFLINKNGFTEGQKIFNLKYNLDNLPRRYRIIKLSIFIIIKYLLPFVISSIENHILRYNAEYDSDFDRDDINKWSPFYRNMLNGISRGLKLIKFIYSVLNFFNFLGFISTNKFPHLINRLFNFDYVDIDKSRNSNLSFNYLLKKIIWFELSKIILFLFSKGIGKTSLITAVNKLVNFDEIELNEDLEETSGNTSKCSFCSHTASNVVTAKCSHKYCYYCFVNCKNENKPCKKCFKIIE